MTDQEQAMPLSLLNIVCTHPTPGDYPLGLGVCLARADRVLGGSREGGLQPRFAAGPEELEQALKPDGRNILLCSNYLWSLRFNLEMSRRAKAIDSACLTIHGGPSTPAYPQALEAFLRDHPEVDLAVCGEGENTLAEILLRLMADRLGEDPPPGVGRLVDGHFKMIPSDPPIENLDSIPSPYLTGLFDQWGLNPKRMATIETNRGCPYGCAYCSWNDPLSPVAGRKVRYFDLDRVLAEIEYVAAHEVENLFIADSNFGIHSRDVDIALAISRARRKYGYPRQVTINYAKNHHENLVRIVDVLDHDKLLAHGGIVSVQTRDPQTLKIIRRQNIKPEKYDELRDIFAARGYPLYVQLMLGLPGATAEAFMADLRHYFDQPVEVTMFQTILLPNSAMADPAFREEYAIEADDRGNVLSTSTMPRETMREMVKLGCLFDTVHNLGILRLPVMWLWRDNSLDPLDILAALVREPDADTLFPNLLDVLDKESTCLENPFFRSRANRRTYDWDRLHANFGAWAGRNFGLDQDPAFLAVLRAQSEIMPRSDREYPFAVDLDFDVPAWLRDRRAGGRTRLADYGPGRITVREQCYFWNKCARKNLKPEVAGLASASGTD